MTDLLPDPPGDVPADADPHGEPERSTAGSIGPTSLEALRRENLLRSFSVRHEGLIALVCHEDTHNWNKLHNLFYVSVGLAAGCAVALQEDGRRAALFCALASATGFVLALLFFEQLIAGVRCLKGHKRVLMDLEQKFLPTSDICTFADRIADGTYAARRTASRAMLYVAPILVMVMWGAATFASWRWWRSLDPTTPPDAAAPLDVQSASGVPAPPAAASPSTTRG